MLTIITNDIGDRFTIYRDDDCIYDGSRPGFKLTLMLLDIESQDITHNFDAGVNPPATLKEFLGSRNTEKLKSIQRSLQAELRVAHENLLVATGRPICYRIHHAAISESLYLVTTRKEPEDIRAILDDFDGGWMNRHDFERIVKSGEITTILSLNDISYEETGIIPYVTQEVEKIHPEMSCDEATMLEWLYCFAPER